MREIQITKGTGHHFEDTYNDHKNYCKATSRICTYCEEPLFFDKVDATDTQNWHTEKGATIRREDDDEGVVLFYDCTQAPQKSETYSNPFMEHKPEEPLITMARKRHAKM